MTGARLLCALALALCACDAGSSDHDSESCWHSLDGQRLPPAAPSGEGFAVDGHYFASAQELSGAGALLHFDMERWSAIPLADEAVAPSSIWASSADDVLAVEGSRIWRWDGHEVQLEHELQFEGVNLNALWGVAHDDVWVGGHSSVQNCFDCNVPPAVVLLHFDGHRWLREALDVDGTISALWGTAPDDVWAAGSVLLHYDGTSWQHVMDLDGAEARLWGAAPNAIWLATGSGSVWHADGKTWSPIDVGELHIQDVRGLPDGRVFAYANAPEPELLEWTGTTFVAGEIELPASSKSAAIRLGSDDRLLLLDGRVFALENETFEPWYAPSPHGMLKATARLAAEPEHLLAARGSSLASLEGRHLAQVADLSALPDLVVYDLAAGEEDDVWIAGLLSETEVFHWNGSTLMPVVLPEETQLSFPKVEVDDQGRLWIAGVERAAPDVEDPVGRVRVFRFDGGTWEDASPELDAARAVDLSIADGQTWVTVNDGRVAVWERSAWRREDIRDDAGDAKLVAVKPNDVYAIATSRGEDDAQLLHYDGSGWSPVEALGDRKFRYVDGAGPNDVWATGYPRSLGRQLVVRFDGETWEEIDATVVEDIAIPTALPNGRALLATDLGAWLYDCGEQG